MAGSVGVNLDYWQNLVLKKADLISVQGEVVELSSQGPRRNQPLQVYRAVDSIV